MTGGSAGGGAGGMVGTRGPGETQLEVDRRKIREKLTRLKARLRDVERTRSIQRQRRLDGSLSDGRAGRLHQFRKIHLDERADRGRRRSGGSAVLDA